MEKQAKNLAVENPIYPLTDGFLCFFDLLRISFLLTSVSEMINWASYLEALPEPLENRNIHFLISYNAEESILTVPPGSPVLLDALLDKALSSFSGEENPLKFMCKEIYSNLRVGRFTLGDIFGPPPFRKVWQALQEVKKYLPSLATNLFPTQTLGNFRKVGAPFLGTIATFKEEFAKATPLSIRNKELFSDFIPVLSYLPFLVATFDYWTNYPRMDYDFLPKKSHFQMIYSKVESASYQSHLDNIAKDVAYKIPALRDRFFCFQESLANFSEAFLGVNYHNSDEEAYWVLDCLIRESSAPLIAAAKNLMQAYADYLKT